MDGSVWIYLTVGLLLAVCLIISVYYLKINFWNPEGKGAEKKTTGTLRKFGTIRGFKVLTNLQIRVDGKTAHIENLLIGYFGMLIVTTCGARGGYYGTMDADTWVLAQNEQEDGGGKSVTIQNPVKEQQRAMSLLRSLLSKHNIYNVPIENVVYMTSKSRKSGIYITNNGEILAPGKLGSYLGKTKFEKDIGLDVAKTAEVIEGNGKPAQ